MPAGNVNSGSSRVRLEPESAVCFLFAETYYNPQMERDNPTRDPLMHRSVLVTLCIGLTTLFVLAEEPALKYPTTKKGEQTDTLHGVQIADPYRWLEDDVRESKAVAAWVEAEN